MKYDFLIVGAGLYGASAARALTDRGARCLIIDRRAHIAGNAYTEDAGGVTVHRYGAHIFHTDDEEVWAFVSRFARMNGYTHRVQAEYGGRRYALPFNMHTFHAMWGVDTPEAAQAVIAAQRGEVGGEPQNLEEQAVALVGRDVYERLIRGYTEKQWGRPCRELPPEIIRRIPCRFTWDDRFFSDAHQGVPEDGYTQMIARMLEGIDVRLSCDYRQLTEREPGIARRVIYSGCIDEFFDYRLGALAYRSLRFETEILDRADYQGMAVVNHTAGGVPYTRVIEHRHFTPERPAAGHTIVTREYPQAWQPGLEPYYPVGDKENTKLYAAYKALAKARPDVHFGGRLGAYRYIDMDEAVRAALDDAAALWG